MTRASSSSAVLRAPPSEGGKAKGGAAVAIVVAVRISYLEGMTQAGEVACHVGDVQGYVVHADWQGACGRILQTRGGHCGARCGVGAINNQLNACQVL